MKECIFVGPQIRYIINASSLKIRQWGQRKSPGKHTRILFRISLLTTPNYIQPVDKLFTAYKPMNCRLSLKIHLLHWRLDFFPWKSRCSQWQTYLNVSPGNGHYEKMVSGSVGSSLLADYCWTLQIDELDTLYK